MNKSSLALLTWSLVSALTASLAGAAITGVVIDRDGKAIEGAVVTAFEPEAGTMRTARLLRGEADAEPLARVETDSRGRFSLDAKGAYSHVRIEAPGHLTETEQIADGSLGAIALERGTSANLVILGEGKPVAGALVAAGETVLRSDAEGRVTIPYSGTMLPAIEVFHSEFAPRRFASRHPPRSIALDPGVEVSGTVADAAGSPVSGARIEIDGYPLGTTGEDGSFKLARAPKEWKEIVAIEGDRIGAASRRSDGKYGLKLVRGATIAGSVTSADRTPLPGAVIHVGPHTSRRSFVRAAPGGVAGTVSDARGNFTIGPLAPGSYDLSASRSGHGFATVTAHLDAGERIARNFAGEPLGVAQGTVVDENGRAVPAAAISARPERRVMGMMTMPRRAWAGPDGTFVLRNVPTAQNVALVASRTGFPESEPEPVELAAGERKSGLVLTIPRGIEITGVVSDVDGVAIAGARVRATESRGGVPGEMVIRRMTFGGGDEPAITTGAKGEFSLRATRGRWDLTVWGDGYAPALVRGIEVAPGVELVEVTLREGAEVSGRVVRADGTGVADVMVNVFGEAVVDGRATTAPDGSFTLRDLPPGMINLMAIKPDEYIRENKVVEAPARNVLIEIAPGGAVRGRVVDKGTKRPVTDFRAGPSGERRGRGIVMMGPSSLRPFRSEDGAFELTNLPVGSIELAVEAPGFVPAKVPVEIEEGKTLEGVEVTLEAGTTITGRVSGPEGSPLSGASVARRPADSRFAGMIGGMASGGVTTDANGEFTLEGVAEGEQTLVADREGYLSDTRSVEVEGREMRVDFRLGRGIDVTGAVVTDAGIPVSQASVRARTSAAGGDYETARSDANGNFRFSGLAPGRYTFVANHEQYVAGEAKDVDIATSGPVRITLAAGGTISGRITGLRDDEISSAMVLALADGKGATSAVAPDGSFRITGAPTGTVRVEAQVRSMLSRRTSTPRTVEVAPGTESHVDLDMGSGYSVTGRVTRGGRPVEGAHVNFNPRDPRVATTGSGRADTNGRYEVTGLESGEYQVYVFDMESIATFSTTHTVAGPGTFDIDMVGTAIRGTVVDATTNEAVEGASVVAEEPSGSRTRMGGWPVRTDARGAFAFESMSPGAYSIRASKDGFGQQVEQVVVGEGSDVTVELRLQKSDGAGLKIVDARDGRSLDGYASIVDGMGRLAWQGRVRNAGKEFTTIPLAAGRYRALVNASGYAARTVDLIAPAAGLTIGLSPGGTVRIEPVSQQRVLARILDASGQPFRRTNLQAPPEFVLDGTGVTITNVVPGNYTVEILDAAGGVTDSESFTVVEGQTVVVRP